MQKLNVREIEVGDINALCNYWFESDPSFLVSMGVDLGKIPKRSGWETMLKEQIGQTYNEKKSYCLMWLLNDIPIGHCNVNQIKFGEEAYMHLHIWKTSDRTRGLGLIFVRMSLPWFFEKLHLKKICCEPYSKNPAPHKTIEKAGFEFIKEYTTVPGWINFKQPVKHWELSLEKFQALQHIK